MLASLCLFWNALDRLVLKIHIHERNVTTMMLKNSFGVAAAKRKWVLNCKHAPTLTLIHLHSHKQTNPTDRTHHLFIFIVCTVFLLILPLFLLSRSFEIVFIIIYFFIIIYYQKSQNQQWSMGFEWLVNCACFRTLAEWAKEQQQKKTTKEMATTVTCDNSPKWWRRTSTQQTKSRFTRNITQVGMTRLAI